MRFAQARGLLAKGPADGASGWARRGRRRSFLAVAVTGLAAVTLTAGCQTGGSQAQSTSTTAITVAAIRGADTAPLFIAIKDGAFARAGLDVKVRTYPSVGDELQAVSKGAVDIASGDYVDFFAMAAKFAHPVLSVIADGYHAGPGVMEVLTYPGSGITSPQQLAHKTIGAPLAEGIPSSATAPYSIETLATTSVLTSDGVNADDITWKPMPASSLISALKAHKVNAILVEEPYIFQAESTLGAYAVLDSCSGATANLPLSGYFALTAFANQRPTAVREFRRVLQQAQKSAVLLGPIRHVLAKDPGMTMEAASLITIGSYPTSLNAASLQRVANLMFNFEMLNQAINVSSLIAH